MDKLKLDIITQEKKVYQDEVDSVTAPASEGEVTILPRHIPLFTRLNPGEITLKKGSQETHIVVTGGFMDVSFPNKVTILADAAARAEEIDVKKAEEAKRRAEELLEQKLSRQEMLVVEASLRKAVLELKVARRTRRRSHTPFPSEFSS